MPQASEALFGKKISSSLQGCLLMKVMRGLPCPSSVKLCSRNLSVSSFQPLLFWFCFQETGFGHGTEIRKSLGGVWGCLLRFRLTWLALLRT